ncbi:MAG: nucleotidyltransferase family protein [Nostoc sp. TH1S01]|nr:nucleotidyltransferase family protein [Nostoc sp. TH1S01]
MSKTNLLDKYIQQNTLTPEIELLICCCRTYCDEKNSIKIKNLLQEKINWTYLIEIAGYHKVLPLLFINLSNYESQFIPTNIFKSLQNYHYLNTRRNLLIASKLINILNIFAEHKIPVIPFKGPVLASTAYGDISRRAFGDLDLLVHSENFIKTKQVLMSKGFEPYSDSSEREAAYLKSLNNQEQEAYLRSHWELHLVNRNEQVTLDVHQGVLSKKFSVPYSSQWIWEDTKLIPFIGKQILSFSPENLIIILCSQGGKDCWLWLNRICDLAEVLRAYSDVNWEKIWQLTIQLKMTRMLLLGLSIAHNVLDAELPEFILQKIEGNQLVKKLTAEIITQLISPVPAEATTSQLKSTLFHLKLIEHPLDKIAYCFEHLIVPTIADKSFIRLPKFLSFLYYFVRPIRMIFFNKNKN